MNETEVTIDDIAFGGAGVGHLPDGKVVFVPYTLVGERVRIRLVRAKKGFSEAELIEVITPSPHRISPPCPYFGRCGGCQYQHATYEEQLRIKQKQVRDTLQRIGGFKELPPPHLEPAPQPYGYRNKISIHRGAAGELGFFSNDNRTVIDVERCLIAGDSLNTQLTSLRKASFKPRHASLTEQVQRPESPEGSFHQVNTAMAAKLLNWLRQQIGNANDTQFIDLYCGAGFFALGLADLFTAIGGMDHDARAIHAATVRAQAIGIAARFFAAPVEERAGWLLEQEAPQKITLLVDPPRQGLSSNVTDLLLRKPCAHLIYVSCNPATLARDLKKLAGTEPSQYSFRALGVFDMFPQTAHIETAAILRSA